MKQRKIAVIAGTSDATDWIRSLPETDAVTAFVATPYGKWWMPPIRLQLW